MKDRGGINKSVFTSTTTSLSDDDWWGDQILEWLEKGLNKQKCSSSAVLLLFISFSFASVNFCIILPVVFFFVLNENRVMTNHQLNSVELLQRRRLITQETLIVALVARLPVINNTWILRSRIRHGKFAGLVGWTVSVRTTPNPVKSNQQTGRSMRTKQQPREYVARLSDFKSKFLAWTRTEDSTLTVNRPTPHGR